jgi:hypothetical protein
MGTFPFICKNYFPIATTYMMSLKVHSPKKLLEGLKLDKETCAKRYRNDFLSLDDLKVKNTHFGYYVHGKIFIKII